MCFPTALLPAPQTPASGGEKAGEQELKPLKAVFNSLFYFQKAEFSFALNAGS